VILRHENIVSVTKTECPYAMPERMTRPKIERAAGIAERVRRLLYPAAEIYAW
jgi:hypothetical protein